jgi:hypothetical protein
MIPVILFALLFVVQFGLAYYARQVLAGAAQDGAAAGSRQGSSPAVGQGLSRTLIEEAGGSLFDTFDATASSDGNVVTVQTSGHVVSLLPFFGTITVKASATAKVESFDPQGQP